jgi:cytochrome P450
MAIVVVIALLVGTYFAIRLVQDLFCFVKRRHQASKLKCQSPPSPPQKDPFFGLDQVFDLLRTIKNRQKNLSLREQLESYGGTFKTNHYGNTKLFTSEPRNLQAVFATDFASWGVAPLRHFYFGPLMGDGIMTTDGSSWERSRALLKPMTAKSQIADMVSLNNHMERLVAHIPTDGSSVDLQPLFTRFSIDTMTELIFGEALGMLDRPPSEEKTQFIRSFKYGQFVMGKRMQLPRFNIFTRDPKFWECCASAREFAKQSLRKAIQFVESNPDSATSKESKYILAHEMARNQASLDQMASELLNIFLPAHDATGVGLTNIFFHLARHSDVWAAIRAEALQVESTGITYDRLKSLKYLNNVINEVFRLNSPITSMNRIALRDTTLPTGGGPDGTAPVFVCRGDIITTSFYTLHRSHDIWGPDADEFRPERWNSLRPSRWNFVPFGGGPRVCPGQHLALTQVAFVIFSFARKFERLENRDPVLEFVEDYKIVTESKNGAKVAFILPETEKAG